MQCADVDGLLKYCTTDRQRECLEAAMKIIQNANRETLQ
jgi:hypothetical protein